MQVLELMKTHVTTTHPEASLGEAVDLMDLYQTPCLPVVDTGKRLCGILTVGDILRTMRSTALPSENIPPDMSDAKLESYRGDESEMARSVEQVLWARQAAHLRVQECMTCPAISISEHDDVRQAAQLLLSHGLKRLPVTDELGRVVGMLNRVDVIQAVFEALL